MGRRMALSPCFECLTTPPGTWIRGVERGRVRLPYTWSPGMAIFSNSWTSERCLTLSLSQFMSSCDGTHAHTHISCVHMHKYTRLCIQYTLKHSQGHTETQALSLTHSLTHTRRHKILIHTNAYTHTRSYTYSCIFVQVTLTHAHTTKISFTQTHTFTASVSRHSNMHMYTFEYTQIRVA